MLKFQKLVVAAVMSMFAVSAMANNFRAADQVYVANGGHVGGGSGTFLSDVFVSNLSTDSVTISIIFSGLSNGTAQTLPFNDKFTLAPNERKEFVDFFGTTLNLNNAIGQLVFNACKQGANCAADQDPVTGISPNFRPITVESRIYVIPPGTTLDQKPETKGQLFAGTPWYMFASQEAPTGYNKVEITGIRVTGTGAGTYRTNLGLVNASQFSSTRLRVTLFNGNNSTTPIGVHEENLGPLGFVQQNVTVWFPQVTPGATSTNIYAIVEQISATKTTDAPDGCPTGCPAFLAYGSVLDNVSSDPTTLEAQFLGQLTDIQIGCIFNPESFVCTQKTGGKPLRRAAKPRG